MARTRHSTAVDALQQRIRALDAASIDQLYGLEPVYEPGADGASSALGVYVEFLCPWCCEHIGTSIDLTGGSRRCVEDCEVCCQPMDLSIEVDERGRLRRLAARREE